VKEAEMLRQEVSRLEEDKAVASAEAAQLREQLARREGAARPHHRRRAYGDAFCELLCVDLTWLRCPLFGVAASGGKPCELRPTSFGVRPG
jgi:hypothetical protein